MKKSLVLGFLLIAPFVACQNGPTQPSVQLSWTQSTSSGVTANCIYRGATAGTYTLPALFCSASPITTYVDNTVVRGQTYHYAVTAQAGAIESAYSNDATAAIPTAPAPPTGNAPSKITKLEKENRPSDVVATVTWK